MTETMFNPRTREVIVVIGSRVTTEIEYENVKVGTEKGFCDDCQCYEDIPIFERREISIGTQILSVNRNG